MRWFSYKFYQVFKSFIDPILEKQWNNNWRKANIVFVIESGKSAQDVRARLDCISAVVEAKIKGKVKDIIKGINSNDEKVFLLFNWVLNNIKYKSDKEVHWKMEFWQTPDETWTRKTGDCEDHAILLMKMIELAGVPLWRVKICCGDVVSEGSYYGHAYPIYLREEFNQWFAIDTAFYPNTCWNDWNAGNWHKKSELQKNSYATIWWTFNKQYCWLQDDVLLKNWVLSDVD